METNVSPVTGLRVVPEGEVARELIDAVLWRGFAVFGEGCARLIDTEFVRTERGSYMGRVILDHQFIMEPVAFGGQWTQGGRTYMVSRGVVLFLEKAPPADWTWLRVAGISKSGNALFAKYGGNQDVLPFYQECAAAYTKHMNDENYMRLEAQRHTICPVTTERRVFVSVECGRGWAVASI